MGTQRETAPSAFTMPAPKNDVLPAPPTHCRGSAAGQPTGQVSGVADDRTRAATAPWGMFGYFDRMSAATPATCGDAIDVPLIHT